MAAKLSWLMTNWTRPIVGSPKPMKSRRLNRSLSCRGAVRRYSSATAKVQRARRTQRVLKGEKIQITFHLFTEAADGLALPKPYLKKPMDRPAKSEDSSSPHCQPTPNSLPKQRVAIGALRLC